MNFNMHRLEATLPELLNKLDIVEKSIKGDNKSILLVFSSKEKSKIFKKKKVKKGNKESQTEKAIKSKVGINKDKAKGACHHYGKEGHWKWNCKVYLAS